MGYTIYMHTKNHTKTFICGQEHGMITRSPSKQRASLAVISFYEKPVFHVSFASTSIGDDEGLVWLAGKPIDAAHSNVDFRLRN